mmetsp:Transcript_56101/g.159693  ORF Transcript_56101/g.159693 Transcript_56101/m.159693 type:complete len:237 (-) Transcript_56101:1256-1966(-)
MPDPRMVKGEVTLPCVTKFGACRLCVPSQSCTRHGHFLDARAVPRQRSWRGAGGAGGRRRTRRKRRRKKRTRKSGPRRQPGAAPPRTSSSSGLARQCKKLTKTGACAAAAERRPEAISAATSAAAPASWTFSVFAISLRRSSTEELRPMTMQQAPMTTKQQFRHRRSGESGSPASLVAFQEKPMGRKKQRGTTKAADMMPTTWRKKGTMSPTSVHITTVPNLIAVFRCAGIGAFGG